MGVLDALRVWLDDTGGSLVLVVVHRTGCAAFAVFVVANWLMPYRRMVLVDWRQVRVVIRRSVSTTCTAAE